MAKRAGLTLLLLAVLLAMLAVAAANEQGYGHSGGHHKKKSHHHHKKHHHHRHHKKPHHKKAHVKKHHVHHEKKDEYQKYICKKKGSVCHDPVLVGADGERFYFHGHKDADFCLVSDTNLHINAHFIGRRREGMSRDFTWVQSLGILFGTHQLYVGANKVAVWDDNVDQLNLAMDSVPIVLPSGEDSTWELPSAGVTIYRLTDKNSIVVEVEGQFKLLARVVPITEAENQKQNYGITPGNCFAHLEINFEFHSLSAGVTGVLGQTYAPSYRVLEKKPGQLMPRMGGDDQYEATGLMAPDCSVTKFGSADSVNEILKNLAPMRCSSQEGDAGDGMVCRR